MQWEEAGWEEVVILLINLIIHVLDQVLGQQHFSDKGHFKLGLRQPICVAID